MKKIQKILPLWQARQKEATDSERDAAARAAAALAALAAPPVVPGRARLVNCVVQAPILLNTLTQPSAQSQYVDGVQVQANDRVLLTAQVDRRENGLWIAGIGATSQAERSFALIGPVRRKGPFSVLKG